MVKQDTFAFPAAAAASAEAMEDKAMEVAAILKTLAHPARLMLACALVEGEYSVGQLEERLDIHQPTLSQQLTVLREAGIVDTRRDGKQIFYCLTAEKMARLLSALYAIFCSDGDNA